MKSRRISADLVWLFVLLLVFCVLSFQIASRSPDDSGASVLPHRTTISTEREGWKAFYLTLKKSVALPVDRWTRGGPTTWPADASVMICGPAFGTARWTKEEAKSALTWVSNGGTIVILSDAKDELTDEAHLEPLAGDTEKDPESFVPAQPALFFHGVNAVVVPSGSGWQDSDGQSGVSLLKGSHKLALVMKHKAGWVLAIASPAMADNSNLAKAGNADFLVQAILSLARRRSGGQAGAILFDEFHQGFADDDSLWGALGRSGQLVVYQLLVLVLLMAYSMSRRFGLPRPAPEASRISSEYVTSLANLYQRAGATDAALQSIYWSFKHDLCAGSGYPLDAPTEELAPGVMTGLGFSASDPVVGRLQQLMDTCEAKINAGAKSIPENELLQLVRSISDMRRELNLGGFPLG